MSPFYKQSQGRILINEEHLLLPVLVGWRSKFGYYWVNFWKIFL
jgi:hypothetical protein